MSTCDLTISALNLIVSIVAAIYAIRAYCFATKTYTDNIERERIRATVSDFPALRHENEELQTKLEGLSEKERELVLKSYAAQMERFAVGVNCGAYSLDIINHMSGGMLVQQYKSVIKGFIKVRRTTVEHSEVKAHNVYNEYETMMKSLYRMRNIQWED